MASLARDIHVSFDSVRNWIEIFENFFMVFRIAPWTRKISRAITKEKKLYLFDYAGVDSPAAKFENNDNQRRSLAVVAAVTKFWGWFYLRPFCWVSLTAKKLNRNATIRVVLSPQPATVLLDDRPPRNDISVSSIELLTNNRIQGIV
jgi:uncharacterized protein DUF4143